jgi:hypothetical protein
MSGSSVAKRKGSAVAHLVGEWLKSYKFFLICVIPAERLTFVLRKAHEIGQTLILTADEHAAG